MHKNINIEQLRKKKRKEKKKKMGQESRSTQHPEAILNDTRSRYKTNSIHGVILGL